MNPIPQFPKIIGFDVPRLAGAPEQALREPALALLDGVPSEGWARAFAEEVACADADLASAELLLAGDRIAFTSTPGGERALFDLVRQFVEHVSVVRQRQRMVEAGVR